MDWSRTALGRYGHVAIFTSMLLTQSNAFGLLVENTLSLGKGPRGGGGQEPKRSEGCPEVYGRQEISKVAGIGRN